MLRLLESVKSELDGKKNLLAFSGGVDSSALFFLLLYENIEFDIAIVDFGVREQSKQELSYAKELANKYNKNCFTKEINLQKRNFEHNARLSRYKFFEELIELHDYDNLLTAHQLNDKLEWFLMQLLKGSGLVEMLGFEMITQRDNYKLIRPLIKVSKDELLNFLHDKKIKYFIDDTNFDKTIKRNKIRHEVANEFIKYHKSGILKSFSYLELDSKKLHDIKIVKQIKNLFVLENLNDIRQIDKIVKRLGYILSSSQREEILKNKDIIIADQIAIVIQKKFIFIAPYRKIKLDKEFKERCRVLKVPPKIRYYLKSENISAEFLMKNLI